MFGTIVNTLAIIGGSLVGVLLRGGLPEAYRLTVIQAIGLAVVLIGLRGAFGTDAILLVICSFFMKDLNLISLSDERASQLGVDTERVKMVLLVLASLIAAAAVSVSGIIGFVGLITPHIMRLLVGPDNKKLLPSSAIAGGIVLLFSDTIARTVLAPREIPVGIITAIIGVPFFIYLLLRSKKEVF